MYLRYTSKFSKGHRKHEQKVVRPGNSTFHQDVERRRTLGLMYLRYTSKVKSELMATISPAPLEVTAMKQMMTTSTAPAGPMSTSADAGMTSPDSASVELSCRDEQH